MKLGMVLLGILLCIGCAQNSNPLGAPEIASGYDVCAQCGMLISDAKFAAATLDLKGNAHKFDDVSGMLLFHMEHPEYQVRAYFVHDYHTQAWLRGEDAYFVRSEKLIAPMDDGIAAFANEQSANAFAARVQGTVYKLDALRLYVHVALHASQ